MRKTLAGFLFTAFALCATIDAAAQACAMRPARIAQPVGDTPEHFSAYIKSEIEKRARVVRFAGAKID